MRRGRVGRQPASTRTLLVVGAATDRIGLRPGAPGDAEDDAPQPAVDLSLSSSA